MTRWLSTLAFAIGVLVAAGAAEAQRARRVNVRVVDVAGRRAFIEPGEDAGITTGTTIRIGESSFEVIAATRRGAVVEIGEATVEVGARGVARGRREAGTRARALRPVEPLERFRGQWVDRPAPAQAQRPRFVPLGAAEANRRLRLMLSSSTVGYVPLGQPRDMLFREQVRARLHAEPIRNVPFAIDADATLQVYAARNLSDRPGDASRPILRVQQLQLSYGRDRELYMALGRMMPGPQSVGLLDGIRLRAPAVGGVSLGAFGGIVPGLFDNAPSFSVGRFGVDVTYDEPELAWRPSMSVIAQGSFFEGRVDERRLSAYASLNPSFGRIGGYAMVDLHDVENPWNARPVELYAAGAETSVRAGAWQGGLRFDYRRPERSLWLASQLPESWLCGGLGTETTPCRIKHDGRYFVSADTSVRAGHVVLAGGGSFVETLAAKTLQGSAFVQMRIVDIADVARIHLTGSGFIGSLQSSYAGGAEFGFLTWREKLDVVGHYRASFVLYAPETSVHLNHMAGGTVRIDPRSDLSASLSIDGLTGRDVRALLVQLVVVWRPDFRLD